MDKSIEQMARDLASAGYAKETRESYLKTVEGMAEHFHRSLHELGRDDLRVYVEQLRTRPRSASWLKAKLAALVFLYKKTLGRPNDVSFVCWPKQHSALPPVLAVDETHA